MKNYEWEIKHTLKECLYNLRDHSKNKEMNEIEFISYYNSELNKTAESLSRLVSKASSMFLCRKDITRRYYFWYVTFKSFSEYLIDMNTETDCSIVLHPLLASTAEALLDIMLLIDAGRVNSAIALTRIFFERFIKLWFLATHKECIPLYVEHSIEKNKMMNSVKRREKGNNEDKDSLYNRSMAKDYSWAKKVILEYRKQRSDNHSKTIGFHDLVSVLISEVDSELNFEFFREYFYFSNFIIHSTVGLIGIEKHSKKLLDDLEGVLHGITSVLIHECFDCISNPYNKAVFKIFSTLKFNY